MTNRVHELQQAHIDRLVEQIKAVRNMGTDPLRVDTTQVLGHEIGGSSVFSGVIGDDLATVPDQTISEDELLKRVQKELAFYNVVVDELDTIAIQLTRDTFLLAKLDAYRDALIKARNACFEILFCIDISR